MKKLSNLFILLFLINCQSQKNIDNNELIGTWQLIEINRSLVDENFDSKIKNSKRTITFFADNSFTSKGNFCYLKNENDFKGKGIFENSPYSGDLKNYKILIPENCNKNLKPLLEIKNGLLIINYLNGEGSSAIFKKIKN